MYRQMVAREIAYRNIDKNVEEWTWWRSSTCFTLIVSLNNSKPNDLLTTMTPYAQMILFLFSLYIFNERYIRAGAIDTELAARIRVATEHSHVIEFQSIELQPESQPLCCRVY